MNQLKAKLAYIIAEKSKNILLDRLTVGQSINEELQLIHQFSRILFKAETEPGATEEELIQLLSSIEKEQGIAFFTSSIDIKAEMEALDKYGIGIDEPVR